MPKIKSTTAKKDCWRRIGVWGTVFPRCEHLAEVIHCRNCAVFVEAGRSVFERRVPANYREHWTNRLINDDVVETKATESAFVFRVGSEWFSLPANSVDAIAEYKCIHRLPHINNKQIAGVTNISGEILLCYSLEEILGLRKSDTKETQAGRKSFKRFMVTKLGANRYVFQVEDVRGITRYDPSSLKQPPDTIGEAARKYLLGSFNCNSLEVTAINGAAFGMKLEGVAE